VRLPLWLLCSSWLPCLWFSLPWWFAQAVHASIGWHSAQHLAVIVGTLAAPARLSTLVTLNGKQADRSPPPAAQGLDGSTVTGSDLDLSPATKLTSFALGYADVIGTLTLGPALTSLEVLHTPLEALAAPKGAPDLVTASVANASLSGEVPQWLLEAPQLTLLELSYNKLESLPRGWRSDSLRFLSIQSNALTVRACCFAVTVASLCVALRRTAPRLCRLSHNAANPEAFTASRRAAMCDCRTFS
jgi:hypothetical protein